jgi:hypothetical protein
MAAMDDRRDWWQESLYEGRLFLSSASADDRSVTIYSGLFAPHISTLCVRLYVLQQTNV